MPRDGSFHYTVPVGTDGIADQTIDSGRYNAFVHDVETDLNAPRPIVAGGTGATSAHDAIVNLSGEVADQAITNYDADPFNSGSFFSIPGATSAPNSTSYFAGSIVRVGSSRYLHAYDVTAGGAEYVRLYDGTTWRPWAGPTFGGTVNFGGAVTFGGAVNFGGTVNFDAAVTYNAVATFTTSAVFTGGEGNKIALRSGGQEWQVRMVSNGNFYIWDQNASVAPLTLEKSTGAAYFANRVTAFADAAGVAFVIRGRLADQVGGLMFNSNDNLTTNFLLYSSANSFHLDKSGTNLFTVDASGANITPSTASTSPTTGALKIGGGLGIVGSLNAGGAINAANANFSGSITATGALNVGGNANFGGSITATGPEGSQYKWSLGGQVWSANLSATGNWYLYDLTANKTTIACLKTSGDVLVQSTSACSSPTTGALQIGGGCGVSGDVRASGILVTMNGNVAACATAGNNSFHSCLDETLTTKAYFSWVRSDDSVRMSHVDSDVNIILAATGIVYVADGVYGKAGKIGTYDGNAHNLFWTGTVIQAWIDNTNLGNVSITCDYRTKKDVTPLDSTWDAIKALRPIVYTQREYTPPGAEQPLFVADDTWRWGFLAHELQETLLPSAAHGYKDSPTDIQSPNLLAIVAALTRSLQEAMTRIEALEGRAGATYATSR